MLPLITWLCVAAGFAGLSYFVDHVQGLQTSSLSLLAVMTEAALAVGCL